MVSWPGAEPAEVESRIVAPIERILWGVPAVDHIYSVSQPGMALVTVRFKVNESNEESLVKVFERQSARGWILPRGAMPPVIELHSIDEVPFLTLTLWGDGWSSDRLRPLAAELALAGPIAHVEECLARLREQGYEVSLVLQATLAYARLGELDEKEVDEVAGVLEDDDADFRMSTLDRKFLRSLKIAVDEE